MKKTLFVLTTLCLSAYSYAQFSFNDDLEIVQALFKKAKKELIAETMSLKGDEA